MVVAAIIQARMASTRLPGKVLMDINGKPMLLRLVERISYSKKIDKIIVATSTNKEDDAIYEYSLARNIDVYRGSQDDVLNRYYEAAKFFKVDVIVRITADCPLLDPYVMDNVIEVFVNESKTIVTNAGIDLAKRTYPRGLDVEVFSFETLSIVNNKATQNYQREHVTPYIYQNTDEVFVVRDTKNFSKNRWTVDTAEDMEFVRAVYSGFKNELDTLNFKNVLNYLENNPHLKKINQHINQKSHLEIGQ